MKLKAQLLGKTYGFKSVREVLAKANEEKSGDALAGLAAESAQERVAAKLVLAHALAGDIRNSPAVPYEEDEVTRVIQDDIDEAVYNEFKGLSMAELREYILSEKTGGEDLLRLSRGLSPEVIAGLAKLMSNLDLIYAARKITVTARCNTEIGAPGVFAIRLQPNHPTDDPEGILASVMEGLSYGAGDAVIGVNPVDGTAASVRRILEALAGFVGKWRVPTQCCVLAHVTAQIEAVRQGASADLIFQSIAGSQKGNEAFGFSAAALDEAAGLLREKTLVPGPNRLYFETGQGSELSSGAHHGADQVVMEARCYGFARHWRPFLVNTVVGFIGPEYLYDAAQVTRAGLEDHFMGKLSGLPMGCDACYTNHIKADQNDLENLAALLALAGCNYVMGVPLGDDVMLNYQTTSFHDGHTLRLLTGRRAVPEFHDWLTGMEIINPDGRPGPRFGDASIFLGPGY